jgi:hypothetical protein
LGTRELDLKDKIKEKELVGFGKQEIKELLMIKTDAHD